MAAAEEDEHDSMASALPPLPEPSEAASAASDGAEASEDPAAAAAGAGIAPVPAGHSKRSLRKLAKLEMWKAQKAADKEAKRAAQALKQAAQGERQPLTEEELAAVRRRRAERAALRQEERAAFAVRCGQGARIVLDCGFDAEMRDSELKSLTQQIMHVYSYNKKAAAPSNIVLTELGPRLSEQLRHVSGVEDWPGFRMETASYLDLFPPKEKLVYLTSDSPHTLESWDREATYIIGGIVDRNRLKGATMRKARMQGVPTARFPLHEHVKLGATAVLTVNHVVDILLAYQHSGDWLSAFLRVLPQRKRIEPAAAAAAAAAGASGAAAAAAAAAAGADKGPPQDEQEQEQEQEGPEDEDAAVTEAVAALAIGGRGEEEN